jgi:hypothetical protein
MQYVLDSKPVRLDILASSGMAVIGEADGEAAVDAGGGVEVGVKVGIGVGAGVEVGAAIGVKVSAGVGVGRGTLLTDRPQLSVRNPIRRRESARRPLSRFRPILKSIRSKCDLSYCRLQGRFGVAALEC